MREPFGAFLTEVRRAGGVSIDAVAQQANINRATLYRWEKGSSRPRAHELEAVLQALGVDGEIRRRAYLLVGRVDSATSATGSEDELPMPGIGELWRALRMRSGLELRRAAAHLRVQPSTVWRWEQSKAVVPEERLKQLADLYGACPAERTALRQYRRSLAPLPLMTAEQCLDRLVLLDQATSRGAVVLGDLFYLLIEAALWPGATCSSEARFALYSAYRGHANWLFRRCRSTEAYVYALRSYNVLDSDSPAALRFEASVMLAHCRYQAARYKNGRRALRDLQALGELAQGPLPECIWLREMAHFAGLAAPTELALQYATSSSAAAERIADGYTAWDHGKISRNGHIAILMRSDRPAEAEKLLPDPSDTRPLNAVADGLIRAEWCLRTGERATGHAELTRAYAILERCDFPDYRCTADALARQL